MQTTVIYHSADFDGIFCREIAKKFLPEAKLIGWDFSDKPVDVVLQIPEGNLYILDLPVDRVLGIKFEELEPTVLKWYLGRISWIDHHKSSIETHPKGMGYCIDGVAACRLAWQYFKHLHDHEVVYIPGSLPEKQAYIERTVDEPLAVRLAGEYDIWDRRDVRAELFQHGLRSQRLSDGDWHLMLSDHGEQYVEHLLESGRAVHYARTQENESVIKHQGFDVLFEGLRFLACNAARYNSHLFTAGLRPDHDGCLGFNWDGKQWRISLYHAPGKEQHDLSVIAQKFGGGGHRGACGFQRVVLPFSLLSTGLPGQGNAKEAK